MFSFRSITGVELELCMQISLETKSSQRHPTHPPARSECANILEGRTRRNADTLQLMGVLFMVALIPSLGLHLGLANPIPSAFFHLLLNNL